MERTCERCSTHFQIPAAWARQGRGRFCGRDCYTAYQREHPHGDRGKAAARPRVERACPSCGKTFRASASRPRTYCSRPCYARAAQVDKVCARCGRSFSIPRNNADRYNHCSIGCARAGVTYRACVRCGKVFTAKRADNAHCSEECRRPPVNACCLTCGEVFRVQPARAEAIRFCSVRCYRRHTGETVPESNVRRALDALGITYGQEVAVPGWQGPVDFVTAGRVAIEVDEPYWHARTAGRDARKTLHLQGLGYVVVRLVATPFYGPFAAPMVDAVRAALAVAEHAVPASDVLGLYPLQLALPLDQERVVGGGGHP